MKNSLITLEFIWFEKSVHAPNGEESEKFNNIIIEKILPETSEA